MIRRKTLRALLESLRRHVQRGHHLAPSYTAFQLIEQMFQCLAQQEFDARLQRPLSPGIAALQRQQQERIPNSQNKNKNSGARVDEAVVIDFHDGGGGSGGERRRRAQGNGDAGKGNTRSRSFDSPAVNDEQIAVITALREENRRLRRMVHETAHEETAATATTGGLGVEGAVCFPTEAAYRLAVTKLIAQLKSAKERFRSEKETSRETAEKAEQVRQQGEEKRYEDNALLTLWNVIRHCTGTVDGVSRPAICCEFRRDIKGSA